MAFTLLTAVGTFVPASRDNIVGNQAIAGFASQDPTAQAALLGNSYMAIAYDARATATTTAADAGSVVLDLSARGVTFPTGFVRLIRSEAWGRTPASTTEAVYCQSYDLIIGGTNPTRVTPSGGTPRIQILTAATTAFSVNAAINTTPNPDTVEIQITGLAATNLTWDVRVYVGPLVALA